MKKKIRKMKAQGGAFELEDGEDGDGTEDEDSQELEDSQGGVFEDDVSRSVGASSEARSQGGPEEERDHLEPKEPHDTEGDSQDTAELEESEHLQDAPPLVGATPGTESSSTSSPPKLTAPSEVEEQHPVGPAAEGKTQSTDNPGEGDQSQESGIENPATTAELEDTEHLQDAPPLVGASAGTEGSNTSSLPLLTTLSKVESQIREKSPIEIPVPGTADGLRGETQDQREAQVAAEVASLQENLTPVGGSEQESEEEGPEQEVNREDGKDEAEVPKHRRTYCRYTNCATCKVPCEKCSDCTSISTKTGCRERPQCPNKKPRDRRTGKSKEGKVGSAEAQVTPNRGRTMGKRSKSITDGTPVKIPDIFRAPEAPDDSSKNRKRKQGESSLEDIKRRNTSQEPDTEGGKTRRNSVAEASPSGTNATLTQTRRPSCLPVSRAKMVGTAEEAAPLVVVAVPNP